MKRSNRDRRRLACHGTGKSGVKWFVSNPCDRHPLRALRMLQGFSFLVAISAGLMFAHNASLAGVEYSLVNSTGGSQNEYKLGAQDKIRIMVYEWRPSRDEIFAWPALNTEYNIGPSGRVALPLIGEIFAEGSTAADLATTISERLRDEMGLATAPRTAVEVVQFRPFYVAGDVEKPGEYSFRPGLTVLKAMSISGGLMRAPQLGTMRLERDIMTSEGELKMLTLERQSLVVRQARLEAELNKADDFSCPPALMTETRSGCAGSFMNQEKKIFDTRRKAFDTQMSTLNNLMDYLKNEARSITGQIASHKKQIQFVSEELSGIVELGRKGLATAPRRLGLARNVAQLEGDGMKLDQNLMRVRQEISKNEIAILDIENKRSGEVTTDLQQTQLKLEQNARKAEMMGQLLREASVIAPLKMQSLANGRRAEPKYTVTRVIDGVPVELTAGETTALEPGDTLKVTVPLPMEDESRPVPETMAAPQPEGIPPAVSPKRAELQEHLR